MSQVNIKAEIKNSKLSIDIDLDELLDQVCPELKDTGTVMLKNVKGKKTSKNTKIIDPTARRLWLMALNWDGKSAWEVCQKNGIITMGCYFIDPDSGEILDTAYTDFSNVSISQFNDVVADIARKFEIKTGLGVSKNNSNRASMRHFTYDMNIGDTVYIRKEKGMIVGKGKIVSGYKYDKNSAISGEIPEIPWEHYREVEWDESFKPFKFSDITQHTVLELKDERLNNLLKTEGQQ